MAHNIDIEKKVAEQIAGYVHEIDSLRTSNRQLVVKVLQLKTVRDTFSKLNDRLSEDLRTANGKIYELQAIESDAVEFKDWCDSGKAWFFDVQEEYTHTTEELYKLFLKNKKG